MRSSDRYYHYTRWRHFGKGEPVRRAGKNILPAAAGLGSEKRLPGQKIKEYNGLRERKAALERKRKGLAMAVHGL
jgi:hypothetical protein